MKKTLYVNGVVVGEVEATGNIEEDFRIFREFLTAKGLDREVTVAQAMFRQALSFCSTAAILYERDLASAPQNGLSVAPFVVNASFSVELYLKTLHHLWGGSLRGHSLLKLYDDLPSEARDLVVAKAQQHAPSYQAPIPSPAGVRDLVAELDTAFVDWRYVYETGESGLVNVQSVILLLKAVDAVCREQGAA